MRKQSPKQEAAIAYLLAHPELHRTGAKRLEAEVTNPKLSRMCWHRAKVIVGCPPLPAGGQGSYGYKQPAALPAQDEVTHIEVDKPLLVIRFHRRSGLQVQRSKPNRKYLNASMQLFEVRGYVVISERAGVVVLKKGA
jgi:hypothetical protein